MVAELYIEEQEREYVYVEYRKRVARAYERLGSAMAVAVGLAVIRMKAAVLDMIDWMSSCVYRSMGGWQYAYMHAGFDYHRIIIE